MPNLLQRILATPARERGINWPFPPDSLYYGGHVYPLFQNQTLIGPKEEVADDFHGLTGGGYAGNGVVFACLNARMALFTQARPMYRRLRGGKPGELWSDPSLEILRTPWPNGNTSDLLGRMTQDGDLGGNAFILRRPGKLVRLRPDWVTIVHGVGRKTTDAWDPDAEVIGYIYEPGGPGSGKEAMTFAPEEVAHFVPSGLTDPLAPARGMSWLTPLIREIEADTAATTHKLMFFRNGATPSVIVTGVTPAAGQSLQDWVEKYRAKMEGVSNAYKTQFFTAGTSVQVVGSDLKQIDFKVTVGAGETRIAAAAGTPPVVVGLSEGLQGSSLNSGNFQAAMRRFADLTGRPWWASAFASLATIVRPEPGNELWYDDAVIPALKDDVKDAAEVQALNATAIRTLVDGGFEPQTVVAAVNAGDLTRLRHTGKTSVQLQPPLEEAPAKEPVAIPSTVPAKAEPVPGNGKEAVPAGRSELLEYLLASRYDPDQPRVPSGAKGGEWTTDYGSGEGLTEAQKKLIMSHVAKGGGIVAKPKSAIEVTDAERQAVDDYQGSFEATNRIQANPESDEAKAFASAVAKCPIVEGTVYRGVRGKEPWEERIGKIVAIREPVSTSPDLDEALHYGDTIFRIAAQPGTVRNITAISSWHIGAVEGILAPGRFKVTSVTAGPDDKYIIPGGGGRTELRPTTIVDLEDVTPAGARPWIAEGKP